MTSSWNVRIVVLMSALSFLSCERGGGLEVDRSDEGLLDDIARRVDRVLASPIDSANRSRELERIFAEAELDDAAELRFRFEAAGAYIYPSDLGQFARWWASQDAVGAMNNPIAISTAPDDFWQIQVLRTWATQDPEAAQKAWQDGACGTNDLCLLALVAGWFDSDEEGAWSFVAGLKPGVLRQRAMDVLVAQLIADRGIEDAILFVESVDPEAQRRFKLQLYRRMATAVAQRDLEQAAAWAEKHANGPYGDGMLRRVAVRWIIRDGAAGMKWVMSLPPGPQRDDAVTAAARRLIQADREAGLQWFDKTDEHPALEPAWEVYAQGVVWEDPQKALSIVTRIADREGRDKAVVTLLRIWLSRSPDEANNWIEGSDLGEDILAKARTKPKAPGLQRRGSR